MGLDMGSIRPSKGNNKKDRATTEHSQSIHHVHRGVLGLLLGVPHGLFGLVAHHANLLNLMSYIGQQSKEE